MVVVFGNEPRRKEIPRQCTRRDFKGGPPQEIRTFDFRGDEKDIDGTRYSGLISKQRQTWRRQRNTKGLSSVPFSNGDDEETTRQYTSTHDIQYT